MTDAQWHDLVGNFGVVGALLLGLIAYLVYTKLRPRESKGAAEHWEKLRDKIEEVKTLVSELAEKNRHAVRNDLTGVGGDILNALHDLEVMVRDLHTRRR